MRIVDPKTALVSLISFGVVSPGKPPSTQYTVDLRAFRDAQGRKDLRHLPGTDQRVIDFIKDDPRCEGVVENLLIQIADLHKCSAAEWISIGAYDHHGIHISPAVIELLARRLEEELPAIPFIVTHVQLLHQKNAEWKGV